MSLDPREQLLQEALALKGNHWIFELATGSGKSKIALEKVKQISKNRPCNMLIVVPRNVHKQTWKEEIYKWWKECNLKVSYTTYVSFPKQYGNWDFVIFDECHHLSERCRKALDDFSIGHALLLSATISKGLKVGLYDRFSGLKVLKADLRDVIEDGILPDPKVYLMPLRLKNDSATEIIIQNPKVGGTPIQVPWSKRWEYRNVKNVPVHIYCTEQQYIHDLNSKIDWWKRRYMQTRNEGVKTKWLKLCNERLVWLSKKKNSIIIQILNKLSEYRTLTFCSDIEQTEILGKNCINSKNEDSEKILNAFNNGVVSHITSCNMLNEGVNLSNCQIGVYANINSSETIVKQRAGRLLRHPKPVIVIPYYRGTREEELVQKMLENYNPELVKTINFIEEITI